MAWPLPAASFVLFAGLLWGAAGSPAPAHGRIPYPPVVLQPAPSCTLSAMPPELKVYVRDPDGDSLTVTFFGRPLASPAGPDFTLVEIPDTQYYTSGMLGASPAMFISQTRWIVENRTVRNIAAVVHVGDVVENQDNNGNNAEWVAADSCMRPLEDPETTLLPDGIPYGIAPGNHDLQDPGAGLFYEQFFGASRFQGRSYYGGHYAGDNGHSFLLFSAGGRDFIVIFMKLSWVQASGPLQWADSLLTAYSNRRAILVSHYLLDPGPPVTFSPQGQAIYDALKGHGNLILMLCGHYANHARRSDTYNGHTVHTVMANYQNIGSGGNGWLRIMEFSPAHSHIRFRTYSPWLGQFWVDPDSSAQFTLPCDLDAVSTDFQPIATIPRVKSGTTPSVTWAGLNLGRTYEWYVQASDATSATTGAPWSFTTGDSGPPVPLAVGDGRAGSLTLDPVAPNPGAGPSRFTVTLTEPASLTLEILDVSGRRVAVLADGFQPAGSREITWNGRSDGRQVPPGLYVARLESSGRVLTRKFIIAR